jgi:hypothetical protein
MANLWITLRQDSRGGVPLTREVEGSELAFSRRSRLILLVHGYNVSRNEAERSFAQFENNLRKFSPSLVNDICHVYWPGDARAPGIRALMYPRKIAPAIESARLFGKFLGRRRGYAGMECELVIIAHSLGCRMALESLDEVLKTPARVALILMAAAVPVQLLGQGTALRWNVRTAAPVIRSVFFSRTDDVLQLAFPIGQSAGGEGLFPEAVGLKGQPPLGLWTSRTDMSGFGHSDYWPSEQTANTAAFLLGAAGKRQIGRRASAAARSMPTYKPLGRRLP